MDTGFLFSSNENVLKLDSTDGFTILKTIEFYTLEELVLLLLRQRFWQRRKTFLPFLPLFFQVPLLRIQWLTSQTVIPLEFTLC